MAGIADYIDLVKARNAAEQKLENVNQGSIQPSGVPGGGDENVTPTQDILPGGFDGKLKHRIFHIQPINVAVGATQTIEDSELTEYWFIRLDSTSGQAGNVFIGSEAGGIGFPIYADANLKIPARGGFITILNTGAAIITGVIVALAGFDLTYAPGTAGGAGGGPVTVADGADVAEGSTADVAWGGIGAGTEIAILKAIYGAVSAGGAATIADGADVAEGATADAAVITDAAGTVSGKLRGLVKWAFERMPASLGQKTMANSLGVVLASDQSSIPTAASIANGSDVAEGATGDAAVITDAAGTVSGKLRGLVKWAFERMPASLGQKTMANSLPVTLASDQSSLGVTGPLTDAQLRASVVPIRQIDDTNYSPSGAAYTVKYADINATADGDNTVIAAVAAKKITILTLVMSTTGAGTLTLKSGANTNGHLRSGADGGGAAIHGTAKDPVWQNVNVNEGFVINNPAGVDTLGFCSYIEV